MLSPYQKNKYTGQWKGKEPRIGLTRIESIFFFFYKETKVMQWGQNRLKANSIEKNWMSIYAQILT